MGALTKELEHMGAQRVGFLLSAVPDGDSRKDHPLERFQRECPFRFSNKGYVDDGALQKVTQAPYALEESLLERKLGVRSRQASQAANKGLGARLLGAVDSL